MGEEAASRATRRRWTQQSRCERGGVCIVAEAAAESRCVLSGLHLLSRAAEDAEARCVARAAAGGAARRTEASTRFRLRGAGRAGVPMEVMGLMLGEFVDDYTVKVVDVFAMPQVRRQSCPSAREQP